MEETYNKKIGKKIFEARKSKKMTRAKLGQLLNLHETTIKRYEDGEIKYLDIEKLREFANALDISFSELIDLYPKAPPVEETHLINAVKSLDQVYGHLNQIKRDFTELGLTEEDIKSLFHQYILSDTESPLSEYTKENYIPIYSNITYNSGEIKYDTFIKNIVNPFPDIIDQLIGYKLNHSHSNGFNHYALIKPQDSVTNGEIASVIIEGENILKLARYYYYEKDNIVILRSDNDESQTFFNEDIKKVKIVGSLISTISFR